MLPIVEDAAGASQPALTQPQHCQQQEQQSSPAAIATTATHPYQDSSSKRIRRSSFPELDDAAYSAMVKSRRKQQAAERETTRGKRDRTGRRYPGREEVRRKEQEQLTAQRQRYGLQLAAQLGRPFKGPWSEEIPSLVMDQPLPANPGVWWLRLERHGFVAGNMLTSTVETDCLYARARAAST